MIVLPSPQNKRTFHSKLRIIARQMTKVNPIATSHSTNDETQADHATTLSPPKRKRPMSPSPPMKEITPQTGPSPPTEPPTDKETTQDSVRNLNEFIRNATIPIFSVDGLPSPDRPTSYNDDLRLGSFRPIRYTWAGEQRKGISTHIADSSPIEGHIKKATESDFSLAKEIPLPPEVLRSLDIVARSNPQALRAWWKLQLERVMWGRKGRRRPPGNMG